MPIIATLCIFHGQAKISYVTVARMPNQNKGGPSRDILTILLVFVSVVFDCSCGCPFLATDNKWLKTLHSTQGPERVSEHIITPCIQYDCTTVINVHDCVEVRLQ